MPLASRRTSLYFTARWIHSNLRSVSAAESKPRWRHHCRRLSRCGKFFRECLHPNIRALRSMPWLQDCRAQPHWSDWHHSSYFTQNFYIRWASTRFIVNIRQGFSCFWNDLSSSRRRWKLRRCQFACHCGIFKVPQTQNRFQDLFTTRQYFKQQTKAIV